MNKKRILLVVLAVILLAVVAFLLLGTSTTGSGYRSTISGRVGYGVIGGFGLEYLGLQTEPDTWMPFSFGLTGDLKVEVILSGEHTYRTEVTAGHVSNLDPLTEWKPFEAVLRNVQPGTYLLTMNAYEVSYLGDNPLFNNPFGWPEATRNIVKTYTVEGIVIP